MRFPSRPLHAECTETFQAGHVAAFEFFGGVPTKTAYDNTSIAVTKIIGPNERTLTREFLRLESHFLTRPSVLPSGTGQREGPRREPRRLWTAELPRSR